MKSKEAEAISLTVDSFVRRKIPAVSLNIHISYSGEATRGEWFTCLLPIIFFIIRFEQLSFGGSSDCEARASIVTGENVRCAGSLIN